MRNLVFVGPGRLEWREAPDPVLVDGRDALVQPVAVARCDLDPAIAAGLYPMTPPFALGHEMVGRVVDGGDRSGPWREGQLVIVPFQISCGNCSMCRRGLTNACRSVAPGSAFGLGAHGGVDFGGALADLVRVPFADSMLVALPVGVDPVAACGIPDNIADGHRCVAGPVREWPGEAVLVVGGLAPSVGLYAAASARALGVHRVVYVDDDPERLELAGRLGAETLERPPAGARLDEEFAVTVDACVLDDGRDLAIASTAPCGTCTSVAGGLGARAVLPLRSMYLKGIRYETGRVHARSSVDAVLDHVVQGRLDPMAVVTRVVDFDDAAEAMLEPAVKMVFTVLPPLPQATSFG